MDRFDNILRFRQTRFRWSAQRAMSDLQWSCCLHRTREREKGPQGLRGWCCCGVLERFPVLRIVFGESGIGWVSTLFVCSLQFITRFERYGGFA